MDNEPRRNPTQKPWVTTSEAAAALGYAHRSSIIDLIRAGVISAHRSNLSPRSRWRIPRSEIERLRQKGAAA